MKSAKTIIGFINNTLHSYGLTIANGQVTEYRAAQIIKAILADMPLSHDTTKEVTDYCAKYYNYNLYL